MEKRCRVGVVVVTYNGMAWIDACLNSVAECGSLACAFVIDNASTDNCADYIEERFPEVKLIRSSVNVGFGCGNNIGFVEAIRSGCDYVLLLNQDAYLLPGVLKAMVDFLDTEHQYGACSPLHCSPDDRTIDARTFRNYIGKHAPELLKDALLGRVEPHYQVYGVNAALWLLRADVVRRVGGFDPLFFMYGEDDDYLSRLKHHDVRFGLLTRHRIVHQRQSPSSGERGWLAELKVKKNRLQARWMAAMKKPTHSAAYTLTLLVGRGFLKPLASFVEHRNMDELLASVWAFFCLLGRFPAIRRHTRLTRQPGPHFLPGL